MAKTAEKSTRRTKTVAYDVAEQLRTPEEMAAYLDAWFEEAPDDAAGIARALGDIARARGMTQVARDAGLSRESLYRALGEGGNPSFATVLKVARALGVRLHAQVANNATKPSEMEIRLDEDLCTGESRDEHARVSNRLGRRTRTRSARAL
jgi:probable addiction module antidote protein